MGASDRLEIVEGFLAGLALEQRLAGGGTELGCHTGIVGAAVRAVDFAIQRRPLASVAGFRRESTSRTALSHAPSERTPDHLLFPFTIPRTPYYTRSHRKEKKQAPAEIEPATFTLNAQSEPRPIQSPTSDIVNFSWHHGC